MANTLPDLVARLRIDTSDLSAAGARVKAAMGGINDAIKKGVNGRSAGDEAAKGIADGLQAGQVRINGVVREMSDVFQEAGANAAGKFGDGFFYGIDGKLRNANGKFAAEGERAGRAYNLGFESGTKKGNWTPGVDQASRSVDELAQKLAGLATIGAFGALSVGALSLTGAILPIAVALAALPAFAAAASASIATLFVGLNGLGAAFKSSGKSAGGAAVDTTAMKRAVESASRGIVTAEEAVASSMRGVEEAQYRVGRAVRDVNTAQREALNAQKALGQAIDDATRALKDYQTQLAGAAADEESADIARIEAQQRLNTLSKSGKATSLELRKARNDVTQAELAYQNAVQGNADLQAKANDAQAKGVESDQNVIDARQKLEDANNAATEATHSLAQANQGLADSNLAVVHANEDLALAHQRLADAQAQLAKGSAGASGAIDKQAEALAKLAPAARAFVLTVLSLKNAWEQLTRAVQQRLFQGLDVSIRQLANASFPTLQKGMVGVAGEFNRMAVNAAAFMSTPLFQGALAGIFQTAQTATASWANATEPLLRGLTALAKIGEPFFIRFNDFVVNGLTKASLWLNTAHGADTLTTALNKAYRVAGQLLDIAKNLTLALANIFSALPTGAVLQGLVDLSAAFKDLTARSPALGAAIGVVTLALAAFAFVANSAVGAIAAPIAVTVGIGAAIIWLYNKLDPTHELLKKVLGAFDRVRQAFSLGFQLPDVKISGTSKFELFFGLGQKVRDTVDTIKKAFKDLGDGFKMPNFDPSTALGEGQFPTGDTSFSFKLGQQLEKALKEGDWKPLTHTLGEVLGRILVNSLYAMVKFAAELTEAIKAVISAINWGAVGKTMGAFAGTLLAGLVAGVIAGLPAAAAGFTDASTQLVTSLGEGLLLGLGALVGLVVGAVIGIAEAIIDAFKQVLGIHSPSTVFAGLGNDIMQGLLNGVAALTGSVLAFFAGLPVQILNAVGNVASLLYNKGADVIGGMARGIGSGISAVLGFFGGLGSKIAETLGDVGSVLYQKGAELLQGLLNGAGSLITKVQEFFTSTLPDKIKNGFKAAFDIHSPSKVFHGFGGYIMDGLVNGISSKIKNVTSVMSTVSKAVTDGFKPGDLSVGNVGSINRLGTIGSMPYATNGSTVNNNYSVNLPIVPYTSEQVGREVGNQFRFMEMANL